MALFQNLSELLDFLMYMQVSVLGPSSFCCILMTYIYSYLHAWLYKFHLAVDLFADNCMPVVLENKYIMKLNYETGLVHLEIVST